MGNRSGGLPGDPRARGNASTGSAPGFSLSGRSSRAWECFSELGGANSRIANSDLDRWIACRLLRLRSWLKRFRAVWISNEIQAGRLPEPAGSAQYWRATFLPQASITADKGKVGKLNIDLVANRMRSLQTHFAEEGLDWQRELRQISKERAFMKDLNIVLDDIQRNPPPPEKQAA